MRHHDTTEALARVLDAPRRNHFFYGKRMDVQHFEMEQAYGKSKQWLLNRLTLGTGVLCGLRVTVDGNRVCVDPGVAIDPLGREIVVPIRACIDPLAPDDGCCGSVAKAPTAPAPAPTPADPNVPGTPATPAPEPGGAAGRADLAIHTLWLCYRECLADPQPALVSECGSHDRCSGGTVVETFCLKVTPGLPPLQGDPDWCPNLWGERPATPGNDYRHDIAAHGAASALPAATANALGLTAEELEEIGRAMRSRRHRLCELFDCDCRAPAEPCVPLALVLVRDGQIRVESCLVRPRVYSNAKLLDLILCLAEKIDECCGKHDPEPTLQVGGIDFLARDAAGGEVLVTRVQSPLVDTPVAIDRNPASIRIHFTRPYATDQRKPTTHGLNDPDFKRHNVQVLPTQPLNGLAYVPGTLTLEDATTLRFDPSPESPYFRPGRGWQKGRYQIFLRGNEAASQPALADTSAHPLDGEPRAPSGGVISGDGTAGGDFSTFFVVGGAVEPRDTLRVASVEFLNRGEAGERSITRIETPLKKTGMTARDGLNVVRVRFNQPFAQDGHIPATHGPNDPDFELRNVQILRTDEGTNALPFVPGALIIEAPDTFAFVLELNTPRGPRPWPAGKYRLFLRGVDNVPKKRPAIFDLAGRPLDGEPIDPSNSVISGDGTPGGDFTADFVIKG